MRKVSDKVVGKNENIYAQYIFFSENRVYEIMWKNMVGLGRPRIPI
jgi:hypothetical protein